ncbi:MAG: hypothetical protein R3B13_08510 [Polyangiaceae bacterium]
MLRPRLDLYVFAVPGNDPMALLRVWRNMPTVEPAMALRDTFPLVANPPPDTLLMRASGLDFSVFGEDLQDGSLQMIDYGSLVEYGHHEILASLTGEDIETTAKTLSTYAERNGATCSPAAVKEKLQRGAWPEQADAMLQAAAFAHHLCRAAHIAVEAEQSVIWAYRQATLSYTYP